MESILTPDETEFGKYVLIGKLATGGMGEIFLARRRDHPSLDQLLVIKRILNHHLSKKEYLHMFQSEARLASRLHHTNIIKIYEMGRLQRNCYIAMEYVRGKSLRDIVERLRRKRQFMPLAHIIELALQLCNGLAYAHEAKDDTGAPLHIIHRDINPHNLLVSYRGELKIIDFGIAKSSLAPLQTSTGTIKGKFLYMSPEQSAADPIDQRSDIFSLGIVLYELLTLENPFARTNVVLSLEAIQRQSVPRPSSLRQGASVLDLPLLMALHKPKAERFQTVREMADVLGQLIDSGDVPRAQTTLGEFLHRLFEDDIAEEQRIIETERQKAQPRTGETDAIEAEPVQAEVYHLEPFECAQEMLSAPPESHSGHRLDQDTQEASGVSLRRRNSSFSASHTLMERGLSPDGSARPRTRLPSSTQLLTRRNVAHSSRVPPPRRRSTYAHQPAAIVEPIYGLPGPVRSERHRVGALVIRVLLSILIFISIALAGFWMTRVLLSHRGDELSNTRETSSVVVSSRGHLWQTAVDDSSQIFQRA